MLSYTCLGCHGIDDYKNVYPTYSVPELDGQHARYLIAALKEYRSGERSHATMHMQAASLSDQDIEDIAAYFAGTELKPGSGHGRNRRRPRWRSCASPATARTASAVMGDYPTLAGQHADYLARALDEYKQGDRKNAVMPSFMSSVTEAEIQEIAEYYSQQTPPLRTEPRRAEHPVSAVTARGNWRQPRDRRRGSIGA